jgi:hypothetical protein
MLREYFEISLRIASVSVPDNTSAFACLFSAYLKWSQMLHARFIAGFWVNEGKRGWPVWAISCTS